MFYSVCTCDCACVMCASQKLLILAVVSFAKLHFLSWLFYHSWISIIFHNNSKQCLQSSSSLHWRLLSSDVVTVSFSSDYVGIHRVFQQTWSFGSLQRSCNWQGKKNLALMIYKHFFFCSNFFFFLDWVWLFRIWKKNLADHKLKNFRI